LAQVSKVLHVLAISGYYETLTLHAKDERALWDVDIDPALRAFSTYPEYRQYVKNVHITAPIRKFNDGAALVNPDVAGLLTRPSTGWVFAF
jgi:hypothetical protein